MKIIGFVGMPGSGKSVASDVARSMGLKVVVMGDVIRREAARQGLAPTDGNLGKVGSMLRAQEGPDSIARRTLLMASSDEKVVVIDGLRSKEEADFFRANSEEFHLVEIVAPADARMRWIVSRGRPDDPGARAEERDSKIIASCKDSSGRKETAEALERRECRELSWGMYEAMKEADLRLYNEGDLEEFRTSVRRLLEELALD